MSVAHVEVLVEEPSMEAALRLLLPSMLGPVSFEVYPHQCKEELLARLPMRLQGYRPWLPQDWRIVVVVDRDNDDCQGLKERLETMAHRAGLKTRTPATSSSTRWSTVWQSRNWRPGTSATGRQCGLPILVSPHTSPRRAVIVLRMRLPGVRGRHSSAS